MKNQYKNIIIIFLLIIVLGLTGHIIYNKEVMKDSNKDVSINNSTNNTDVNVDINNEENLNTSGKIYIKRNGVLTLENVPVDIIGKYVNQEEQKDYFILNSDGTATISFPSGDNGKVITNDKVTFQLTYHPNSYSEMVTVEFYVKEGTGIYSPMRIGSKDNNGNYEFTITEMTPTGRVGSFDFIKVN